MVATENTFPAQSVTEIEAFEFGCWAVICSITICASRLAEVSLLFLLFEFTATAIKVVRAPSPVARISMAIISSMSVDPRWNRAHYWDWLSILRTSTSFQNVFH